MSTTIAKKFRTIIGFPLGDEKAASKLLHYAQHVGIDGIKFNSTAAMVRFLVSKTTGVKLPEPLRPWQGKANEAAEAKRKSKKQK